MVKKSLSLKTMGKPLQFLFLSTVVYVIISAVLYTQNQGTFVRSTSVEKITKIGIPEIPFSTPNEDTGFPYQPIDEESEDGDDQIKETEKTAGSHVDLISKSLARLQLVFKEHHREVITPPPQS